ncbi:MAG: endonuclease MutS2 [Bacteroidales bacterium]|nr:endonuclease MutS2 [Bacteroidales bacterium]
MIYPENFETKIGFEKIRTLLLDHCVSTMGREWVAKLKFSSNYINLQLWLSQVDEMKEILLSEPSFPTYDYFDLRQALEAIRQHETYLSREDLFDFYTTLKVINAIHHILEKRKHQSPQIKKVAENMETDPAILLRIIEIMDDKGEIKDKASDELSKIRKQLRTLERNNESIIQDNLKKAISSGWTSANTEPAIRNGRVVIPLQATFKRKIKGFIHGESATGQTVFVEPTQLFEINNEMQELGAAEKREITKIFIDFAGLIRPQINSFITAFVNLGLLDFIIAKARLAIDLQAIKPDLHETTNIDWHGARHPLLYLSHRAQNKSIVPLNISLNQQQRILIISGPNAGGKSVTLKTVGLLQYMLQCGLLIPLKSTSIAGIFKHFFIDIGDEQSIENDLSTYSSHLLNMKFFLRNANSKTLFLIDEFGSGTEPNLGGAIAEAILEELNHKKTYGVITTHFANLKLLPSPDNGMINGAMLFNTKQLEPLYELKSGRPGSSFTVEIAKKIGFSETILKKIELKADRRQLDFEEQLQQLDVEKKELDQQRKQINISDKLLTETLEKYQNLFDNLYKEKKIIIEDAQQKAKQILEGSNKIIEQTIKEIKENQADKKKTQKLRLQLEEEKKNLNLQKKELSTVKLHQHINTELRKNTQKSQDKPITKELILGQNVIIKGQKSTGILQEIKGKKGVVTFGNMSMSIPLTSLEGISKTKARELERKQISNYSRIDTEMNDRAASFNMKLDVRGLRVDEALDTIRLYIDEAIQLRIYEVQILHGKGTGALRQFIREYLSGISDVESYKDEHIERGGDGITVVKFGM